jgi:hypothetical protein
MLAFFLGLFRLVWLFGKDHRGVVLENLALRQQLSVYKRKHQRPRIVGRDRWFWIMMSFLWKEWRRALVVVHPDTVVRWQRERFRRYWSHLSKQPEKLGRPQIRKLIRTLAESNPLWRAPRIHGELLKLGIAVSERTVSRVLRTVNRPPSQTWRTFLNNHIGEIVAVDFFTVPTVRLRGNAFRRRIDSLAMKEIVTAARSPWQNAFAERLIGSIRRECLDHMLVLNRRHLGRLLKSYFAYYHRSRTHLALHKDAPDRRVVMPKGEIVAIPEVGGLHHRYERGAA